MIITIREDEHKAECIAPGGQQAPFFSPVMLMSVSGRAEQQQGSMESADYYGCILGCLRLLPIRNDYAVYSLLMA